MFQKVLQHLFGMRSRTKQDKAKVQLRPKRAASAVSSVLVKLHCQCASLTLRTMELLNSSICSLYCLKANSAISLHTKGTD